MLHPKTKAPSRVAIAAAHARTIARQLEAIERGDKAAKYRYEVSRRVQALAELLPMSSNCTKPTPALGPHTHERENIDHETETEAHQ